MGMGSGMMGEGDSQGFMLSAKGNKFCAPCTVLSGQIKMAYSDGRAANVSTGIYVHHVLTNGPSQPAFVSGGLGASGFVGAGDDNGNTPFIYAPRDASIKSGFQIGVNDNFGAQIVLVNYNKEPQTVYMNYDLEYMPESYGVAVKSSLLSAAFGSMKTSRTGPVNTTTRSPLVFSERGNIILAKGHLRKFAVLSTLLQFENTRLRCE
jgi:hypothetical protein